MEDMPKHPRLTRRGQVYWFRAAIPADIRDTYPKAEETFSLRTKEPREALVRVRRASAEVDARFEAHRRKLALAQGPEVAELSKVQLARIEEVYYAHLLDEDEAVRLEGFHEDGSYRELPAPTFEEHERASGDLEANARHHLARGKSDTFFRAEAEDVLSWDGVGINLPPTSGSWKPAERAIQSATVRAGRAIQARNQGDVVPTPEVAAPPPAASSELLASTVRREWIAERSKSRWVPKTKHEHEVWSQHFLDLVGDKAISAYTKADGRAFKRALQHLPPNWTKHPRLRDLKIGPASARAAELALVPMSDKNINKLMNFVSAMWMWAMKQYDEVQTSPLSGLKIEISQKARDDRDPFSMAQLALIFSAPIFTGCESERQWMKSGEVSMTHSGRYWVPLISLFSGARLGEIVQLRTSDVRKEQGILHFTLHDEEEDQRVKNANSRRRIPVHHQLIRLGFGELLEKRQREGEARLFPDLQMGNDGYYSSPFSKYFGRFLSAARAKTAKTTFHSFRHNFEDACRDAGVPSDVMNALQGHGEDGMAARYGRGHVLRTLDKWLQEVDYPELDLSHLRMSASASTPA